MKLRIENFATLFLIAAILLNGCSGCGERENETAQGERFHNDLLHQDHDHHSNVKTKVPEAPEGDTFFKSIIFPKTPPYRPHGHFRYRKDPFPVPEFVQEYPDHFTVDEKGFWHVRLPTEKSDKLNHIPGELTGEAFRQKVVEILSEGLDTRTAAVVALKMGGLSEEAKTLFEKAISENPDDFQALRYWCGLNEAKKPVEVEVVRRRLVEMRPDSLVAVVGLGNHILNTHKEPREAIPYLEKAYRLNPDWHGPIFSLGMVYYRLGEYEKALKYLQASEVFTGPTDMSSLFIKVIKSKTILPEK